MPAHTQPPDGTLEVAFYRDGEEPQVQSAHDPHEASAVPLAIIAAHPMLFAGDVLVVRKAADQPPPVELPEFFSRASHAS